MFCLGGLEYLNSKRKKKLCLKFTMDFTFTLVFTKQKEHGIPLNYNWQLKSISFNIAKFGLNIIIKKKFLLHYRVNEWENVFFTSRNQYEEALCSEALRRMSWTYYYIHPCHAKGCKTTKAHLGGKMFVLNVLFGQFEIWFFFF